MVQAGLRGKIQIWAGKNLLQAGNTLERVAFNWFHVLLL